MTRPFLVLQTTLASRLITAAVSLMLCFGCASKMQQPNGPLTEYDPDSLQLVEDLCRPWGLKYDRVDGVSLVVGLAGTGSDPPPSAERDSLLTEMKVRDVDKPNQVLASKATALGLVSGFIPPGARKGDRFDIEVFVPRKSETSSLRGGWLLLARLREYAMVKNRIASGRVLAHAEGDVLVDAITEAGDDPMMLTRGRILGGGVVLDDRRIGLGIRDGYRSVKTSIRVSDAVNERFHMYSNGRKQGVAKPKDDNFIELLVHPSYRENLVRYMRVIRNISVRETPIQRAARMRSLRDRLFDPPTAALTAIQLEAMGQEAVPTLREAMQSGNPEIRFYAAEALAYINEPSAADALAELARQEPAFRWRALTALGALEDLSAQEHFVELMDEESAETRYGAFRMLRKISPDDPVIDGQLIGGRFHLHKVRSLAQPLVHVSKQERPEVVLFGMDHRIATPCAIFAGDEIVIRGDTGETLTVSRLTAGETDSRIQVDSDLESVLAAIVEVGGTYADVVHAISEARDHGVLESRVAFSAIPELNRTYERGGDEGGDDEDEEVLADVVTAEELDSEPVGSGVHEALSGLSYREIFEEQRMSFDDEESQERSVIGSGDMNNVPEQLFDDEIATGP
ncbi:MAG: flagellar basal body P-ring protein FlgI [Planctomycetota bacterium]